MSATLDKPMCSRRSRRPGRDPASDELIGIETTAWLSLLQVAQVAHAALGIQAFTTHAHGAPADPLIGDARQAPSSRRLPSARQADTPQRELIGRAFKHIEASLRSQAASILDGLTEGLTQAGCSRFASGIAGPADLGTERAADAAGWEGLLTRLCRGVIDVLDGRVRAEADLPTYALHILRRLWWTGAQSSDDLVRALQADSKTSAASLGILTRRNLVEPVKEPHSGATPVFQLTAAGLIALRQAIARQKDLVHRAIARLHPELRRPAVRLLTQLAGGLAREAQGLISGCPDCWAGDQRTCVRAGHYDHCPIRRSGEETWAPVWEEASLRLLADTEEVAANLERSSRANLEMV